jgi:hypothetical protein
MGPSSLRVLVVGVTLVLVAVCASATSAQEAGGALSQQKHNPLADSIILPATLGLGFGIGPGRDVESTVNFQPRIPFKLTDDWRVVTRSNVSILHVPGPDDTTALGDVDVSLFLTPSKTAPWVWGVGPIVQFPTATDPELGTEKWSAGPTAALLYVDGPWVNGILVSHLWSFAGRSSREDVSLTQIEVQVSYTFASDWYIQTSPTISHDWKAPSGQDWVIPIGIDVGRTFTIGGQGMSLQIGAYYNVKKPAAAADWVLETQFTLIY